MKIAVIGAGALGCLFGGHLAAADHDVWLLNRREQTSSTLSTEGITIRQNGDVSLTVGINATTTGSDVGTADLVIVLVRAHQTQMALTEHAACIGSETWVLSLQNGLRNYDYLLDQVGRDRAFCGVTYEAAITEEPGTVTQTSTGLTTFGGGNAGARTTIQETLAEAGFDVEVVTDPRPVIWKKGTLVAATAPVLTLTDCPVTQLTTDPLHGVVTQLLTEAAHVATGHGINIDVTTIQQTIESMANSHAEHRVSMAQDVEQGRRTEIDELNGVIIDLAETTNIEVPANRQITALIHGVEQC
ncbi:ketopantoate reductase [Haladaptatus litoreus]|uniref:2-dehydropantoate 2-reductase n=1 Tax=Haladaptatus litoreus TaxID=553468 RepID=A0A1N7CPB0_9EURY|nr:2-dehydropantoate 2-reductase [Haladaptatus litoreus]SIR65446.1 ketopantoate reductase [Haladaptatus litoreus]